GRLLFCLLLNCSLRKHHVDFPIWLLILVMIEPAHFELAFFMPVIWRMQYYFINFKFILN
ncbi:MULTISPECIES: hypothetical protein, partial [unclassified Pseudoalteromonas]|uniref:hypothetical protein n=1 Tax=unclassified Pseudoalteromonas TaxID=194690 RepID=UPI001C71BA3C